MANRRRDSEQSIFGLDSRQYVWLRKLLDDLIISYDQLHLHRQKLSFDEYTYYSSPACC